MTFLWALSRHLCLVHVLALLAAACSCFLTTAQAQNILADPGFESALGTVDTTNIPGWVTYGDGSNTFAEINQTIALTDTNYFKVFQSFYGVINYNGVLQDHPTTPGASYTADGWAMTSPSDALAGGNLVWLEVSFRDSQTNILGLYRSAIISTNSIASGTFPANTWIHLLVTNQYTTNFTLVGPATNLVAPPGTTFVRYQIVFQGDQNFSGGSMYFDDQNLSPASTNGTAWNIVWNDEFSGTNINTNHWQFEIGNGQGGWGNNELEYYTSRPTNAFVSNGLLHIVARHEVPAYMGFNYTSARMKTEDMFFKRYGRFEYRAKLPAGQGYWPALWMMPQDSVFGGWAASGEIDVMENIGNNPSNVLGTIHFGGPYPNNTQSFGPSYNFAPGDSVTNFHIYRLDWTNNSISWYVDGFLYERQSNWYSASDPNNQTNHNPFPAPFDQPFYLILNLAVGGNFPGSPNGTTVFPGDMQLDYIRVYDVTAPLQISISQTHSGIALSWPSNIVCHLQAQTNAAGGITTNWVDLPSTTPPYTVPIAAGKRAVFYRLISP